MEGRYSNLTVISGICTVTECRILVDSAVNVYLSYITVMVTGEPYADHIAYCNPVV